MFRLCVIPSRGSRSSAVLPILAMSWGLACAFAAPAATADGKWSPANPTSPATPAFQEIHMALLPGDGNPYHSRIVTWQGSAPGKGAELGWDVGSDGCENAPYALPVIGTWDPGAKIFCGGHAHLLVGTNAELLSVGGHSFGDAEIGLHDARTFAPGTLQGPGSWVGPPTTSRMQQPRFYASATTLADGRAIVTGGQGAPQAWYFGGRIDGDPPATGTGHQLHRYGRGEDTGWDFAITPRVTVEGEFPRPRAGHSTVYLADVSSSLSANVYFGGRDSTGNAIDEQGVVWLLRPESGEMLDADYTYRWEKRLPHSTSPRPHARSEHTAISVSPTEMIVFGGTEATDQEFWRFYKAGSAWFWQTVTVNSGAAPSARFGHAAVYQSSPSRMIVFGGSATLGATPVDNGVYAFNFTGGGFSEGHWSRLDVATEPGPDSRRDHTMVLHPTGPSLLVYGGHLGLGAESDTLWTLDLGGSTLAWSPIVTLGPSPGPRASHAGFYDDLGKRLYVFGGAPAPSAAVDKFAYFIDPLPATGTATWVRGSEASNLLADHTVERDQMTGTLHPRRPEIFNRGANSWSSQSNSGWLPTDGLSEYPVQFVVPGSPHLGGGGRLIRVGADQTPRYLDIPVTGLAGGWQEVRKGSPAVPLSAVAPLKPYTGVMYAPGKILVVGSRVAFSNAAKTLDANLIGTADWVAQPDAGRSHELNLVLLPTGQVLGLGGLDETEAPVQCPRIWTPGAGSNPGTWTAAGSCPGDECGLKCEPVVRDYHSTAMLLPDGRVLTGGGLVEASKTELRVFCPPYLDTEAEWSARPVITGATPASITYGQSFVIGKQAGDSIASACLIRPAATTHGFDQNQRFVPLTLVWESATALRTFAPDNGTIAPPGYYLLFIVNKDGVPAVAKWIRLANCPTVPCDHEPPPTVNDLYVDIVGPNEIWLAWSAPGDDRDPALGAYDLRFATSPITSEHAFAMASQVGAPYPPPTPGPLGSGQSAAKDGLSSCTAYYFALKTHDGATNWSVRANLTASTTCGGGGGAYSARRVDGRAEGAWASGGRSALAEPGTNEGSAESPAGAPTTSALVGAASLAAASGRLVAETRRTTAGGWEVSLGLVSEPEGFDPALAEVIVSQVRGGGGAWKTLGRHRLSAGQSPLGLCALRDQGRVVFPAGYELDRVVSGLREGGQDLTLLLASHSRLGSLGAGFAADGGTAELALGDALTLTYAPADRALPGAASWYVLVREAGRAGSSATPVRSGLGSRLPTRFALHQNQPNPFRRATRIAFDLPVASPVTLEVFDLLGRKVATLARGEYPAGSYAIEWEQRDSEGTPLPPGVYLYRLAAGEFRSRRKMTVAR